MPIRGLAVNLFLVACNLELMFGTTNGETAIVAQCPPHWTFWGQHCYRFFNNHRLDWQSAEQFCNQFGNVHDGGDDQLAHLVSIHSEVENTFVRALWENLREPSSDRMWCWIGYNDVQSEGNFEWTDQSPNDYSKWRSGQPDRIDQDCGALDTWGTGAYVGAWNDGTCSKTLPFMCKVLPVYIC